MSTGVNDWELPSEEIAKLPRPRAIAAIVEGAINDFEEEKRLDEGLLKMCRHISDTLIQHIGDLAYEQDYRLWVETMDGVCAKRGIKFDTKATCEAFVTIAWTRASEERLAARMTKPNKRVQKDFADLVTGGDAIRARGMSITLD